MNKWMTIRIEMGGIGRWDMSEIAEAFYFCFRSAKMLDPEGGISLSIISEDEAVKIFFFYGKEVFAIVIIPEHPSLEMQGTRGMSITNSNMVQVRRAGDLGKRVYSILHDLFTEFKKKKEGSVSKAKEVPVAHGGNPE